MSLSSSLVTAAISALIGCPVITYEEYLRNPLPDIKPLDMESFQTTVLVAPPLDPTTQLHPTPQQAQSPQTALALTPRLFSIFVKTPTGQTITISSTSNDTVDDVKLKIEEKLGLLPEEQQLIYGGKQLKDGAILSDFNVGPDSTIHLSLRIRGGSPSAMYLPQNFLDPPQDRDFTHVNDTGIYFRGGEAYKRPCGWLRIALKVSGKYGSDAWLGSSNAPGEWPVSYHGTGKLNAESIAEVGYKLAKGVRFAFGVGIYSSPNHTIAEGYATEFSNQGRRYKVMLQNRVNPANLKKVPDIDYWVSPTDADIRPYGFCIKELGVNPTGLSQLESLMNGQWRGYYYYSNGSTDTESVFTLSTKRTQQVTDAVIVEGSGGDFVGSFVIQGKVDTSGKITFIKLYPASRLPWNYSGLVDQRQRTMSGHWGEGRGTFSFRRT